MDPQPKTDIELQPVPCSDGSRFTGAADLDFTTITKTQASKVSDGLYPGFNYPFRPHKGMQAAGSPHDDPLILKVEAAYDAYHRLMVEVSGLAARGAGRPSKSDSD